ncbi:MAG: D-tyrosyl-tRNA(Tyr) deacylase [Firmicutes bacterium]|nr:D-tyrosyl-tRNA(Tyr) deacylase [Bacillota bacterium]
MRAVVQRCSRAELRVGGERRASLGRGFVVLVGVAAEDTEDDADYIAEKVANLRVFEDAEGKMNLSLLDVQGAALVVSQFTLLGDARRGRRPSFIAAAAGEAARALYERVAARLGEMGVPVQTGVFGAHMEVELVNDGPVTILLDSRKTF